MQADEVAGVVGIAVADKSDISQLTDRSTSTNRTILPDPEMHIVE